MTEAACIRADALVVLYSMCPDATTAGRLGHLLVDEGLAACANILPAVRSIYRWQGTMETAEECLLLVKTVPARACAARERLIAIHPYAVPCVLALQAEWVNPAYAAWAAAAVPPA